MPELLSNKKLFLPNGKPTNVLYFWFLPLTLAAIILILYGINIGNIILAIFVIGIYSLDILPYKKTLSVIISADNNTLEYAYNNCWGQNRIVIVDLLSATVSFKNRLLNLNYRFFGKIKFGWRIRLYNERYFHNKIVIKEDDKIGYTKDQLDQMIALIYQIKGIDIS